MTVIVGTDEDRYADDKINGMIENPLTSSTGQKDRCEAQHVCVIIDMIRILIPTTFFNKSSFTNH